MNSVTAKSAGIDLNRVYREALTGIHRAYVFMRFGNRGLSIAGFEETAFPGNMQILVVPEPMSEAVLNDYIGQFKAWIVGNGLRELVETFSHFLDEIYRIGLDLTTPDDGAKRLKGFQEASLRSKVQRLRDEFQIEGVFARHFESFTAARNALTHGSGMVRQRDCADNGELAITWRGIENSFVADDGTRYRIGDEPKGTPLREPIELERPIRERRWRVGEKVELSARDLTEICFMANYEAVDVTDALREFAQKHGTILEAVEIIRGGP